MAFALPSAMSRRHRPHPVETESREDALLRRAKRHTRRGETRQAMLALREACLLAHGDARLWALYGGHCARARRPVEAAEALRQAIWLRERASDERRAGALRGMLAKLSG